MFRNAEGYSDPTAGAAFANIGREISREKRRKKRMKAAVACRPRVYVVSKFAGDVQENVRKARQYCRYAISQQKIPIASHLLFPQFLNDKDPREREIGLYCGLALLQQCSEVWCFGTEYSEGMQQELQEAKSRNKTIRYFTEDMEEIE